MIRRQHATVKRSFMIPELYARPVRVGSRRPPSNKAALEGWQEARPQNPANSLDQKAPDPTRIRILSLDSHPLFRAGIARIISEEPDMVLVSQASTVQEAIQQYREHRPDITLMETRLPDLGGIDALIAIRAEFPAARIMILTTSDGDVDVRRALKAGASGYLLKNTPPGELLQEIRKVHSGQKVVQAELAAKLAEHIGEDTLSAREVEVLALVAAGNRTRYRRAVVHCRGDRQSAPEAHLREGGSEGSHGSHSDRGASRNH